MTDEYGRNKHRKKGLFIYQLPLKYVGDARELYKHEGIMDFFIDNDNNGLHIYFHQEHLAERYARKREIKIRGQFFKISLSATCLTIHSITAPEQEIRTLLQSNGYQGIVSLYPVGVSAELNTYVSFLNSGDYRIILKIPEILCVEPLREISHAGRDPYKVSFFCRFCRQNGHKSYDCTEFSSFEPFTEDERQDRGCIQSDIKDVNTGNIHIQELYGTNFSIVGCRGIAGPHVVKSDPDRNTMDEAPRDTGNSLKPETRNMHPRQQGVEPISEGNQPEPGTSNLQPSQQRKRLISAGVEDAISMTVDDPKPFINFLHLVRRRRDTTLKTMTLSYTKHNPDSIATLIKQLQLVQSNYCSSVSIRGPNEDSDIRFINNLQQRLDRLFQTTETMTDSDSDDDV